MPKPNGTTHAKGPYKLPRAQRHRPIYFSKNNYTIITMLAKEEGISRTALVHDMLGTFLRCTTQHHERRIKYLKDLLILHRDLLAQYHKTFGELSPRSH